MKDSALEQYLGTEQARRSAQILLVSSVAGAYLSLAAGHENLALAEDTVVAQQLAYALVKRRHELGLAPETDLLRAQAPLDSARLEVARYTQFVAHDQHALNFLVGDSVPNELLRLAKLANQVRLYTVLGGGVNGTISDRASVTIEPAEKPGRP